MWKLWLVTALLAVAFFVTFPVQKAVSAECGEHHKVVAFLQSKYKEHHVGLGLVSNRGVMELFVSAKTRTWTVLLTNTQGIACIVAAGESYERSKPEPLPDPSL